MFLKHRPLEETPPPDNSTKHKMSSRQTQAPLHMIPKGRKQIRNPQKLKNCRKKYFPLAETSLLCMLLKHRPLEETPPPDNSYFLITRQDLAKILRRGVQHDKIAHVVILAMLKLMRQFRCMGMLSGRT
ncbi:Hypothetical predicted protein [Cloeon dipterum]|uniref:Uncharacterized protein n=1 Tax=Cloeon dipterum TaxID=197152 RepID=A0A8S1DIL9_9INSE|nr:Hypothetical predicted protein [Cloeon dipterum]